MARSRLQMVGEEDAAIPTPEVEESPRTIRYVDVSQLASLLVRGISERMGAVLSALVNLALLVSVFALLMQIINAPSLPQLVATGGYALFVLIALYVRR